MNPACCMILVGDMTLGRWRVAPPPGGSYANGGRTGASGRARFGLEDLQQVVAAQLRGHDALRDGGPAVLHLDRHLVRDVRAIGQTKVNQWRWLAAIRLPIYCQIIGR